MEDNTNSKFNELGELKNHETVLYKTKKGIKLSIYNCGGSYEIWSDKCVPCAGGSRITSVHYKPTKEIMNKFPLENEWVLIGYTEDGEELYKYGYNGTGTFGDSYYLKQGDEYIKYDGKRLSYNPKGVFNKEYNL